MPVLGGLFKNNFIFCWDSSDFILKMKTDEKQKILRGLWYVFSIFQASVSLIDPGLVGLFQDLCLKTILSKSWDQYWYIAGQNSMDLSVN